MFKTTKDESSSNITALIIGESGSGKTSLASTLDNPTLILNLENGLLSLQDHLIDVYDCTVDKEGNDLPRSRRFEKVNHFFKHVYPTVKDKYQNIFIDSITELSQNLVEYLKTQYDESNGFKLWGSYNEFMTGFIKNMRDLKNNVWLIALDAVDKDEMGRRFIGVDVNGKISHRIPALVDEVFYLKVDDGEDGKTIRKLQTDKHQNILAKDRSGKLELFEAPDLQKIINKIQGEKNV